MASSSSPPKPYLPFRGVENDTSLYLPLDSASKEIRYLQLLPGYGDDPIICRLGHTALEGTDRVQYKALSYCWGSVSDAVEMQLYFPSTKMSPEPLDQAVAQRFRITRNLEAALRSLRFPDETRILWIDAICMDQSNPKEKTHQVGLMNLVYSSAEDVVIWLGGDDSGSYAFFRFSELFQERPSTTRKSDWFLVVVDRMFEDQEVRRQLKSISKGHDLLSHFSPKTRRQSVITIVIQSLLCVLQLPWFKRIWVYQEAILAPRGHDALPKALLIMGKRTITWSDLYDTFGIVLVSSPDYKVWRVSRELYEPRWKEAMETWFRATHGSLELTLCDHFTLTANFLASDPRDKLFALLHVGSDTKNTLTRNTWLIPNYEKSFEEAILNFSRGGVHLPLILRAIHRRRRPEASRPPSAIVALDDPNSSAKSEVSGKRLSNHVTNMHQALRYRLETTFMHAEQNRTVSGVHISDLTDDVFQCGFWYSVPVLGASGEDPLIPEQPYSSSGRRLSGIVRSLECSTSPNDYRMHMSTSTNDSRLHIPTPKLIGSIFRTLIKGCKPHVVETSDLSFFTNLLRMLDTKEENIPSWLVFAKTYLTDVLEGPWPELPDTVWTEDVDDTILFRFTSHGGEVESSHFAPSLHHFPYPNNPEMF